MKVAFGFKAHSGWAALVVVGVTGGAVELLDRRRVELAEEEWAKQPYHSAEELEPSEARKVVLRGVRDAHKHALREMRAAVKRYDVDGQHVMACGLLVGSDMPKWSVAEILAVHFRMHKAEGVLFREALAEAATGCGLRVARVPEKNLLEYAQRVLKKSQNRLVKDIATIGKEAGAPWRKDQKEATLAAMISLSELSDEL
jgi:hypothetical protein